MKQVSGLNCKTQNQNLTHFYLLISVHKTGETYFFFNKYLFHNKLLTLSKTYLLVKPYNIKGLII